MERQPKRKFSNYLGYSPNSTEVIGGTHHLLQLILLLLPAKTLVRFRSVSKGWDSLISSPEFMIEYWKRNRSISGLYFYNSLDRMGRINSYSFPNQMQPVPSFSFLENAAASVQLELKILQSSNGLLLLCSADKVSIKGCFVYNPSTRSLAMVPKLSQKHEVWFPITYGLVFDPSVSPHYKVVCLGRVESRVNTYRQVAIYSSESGTWQSSVTFKLSWLERKASAVFWDGKINWIMKNRIVSFDINKEKISSIWLQPRYSKTRYFGEWNGHLHAARVKKHFTQKFSVHELDKDRLKWFIRYQVHMKRIAASFPEVFHKRACPSEEKYAFSVVAVVRAEREEDSELILLIPGKLIAYNFASKTAKMLCEHPGEVDRFLSFDKVCSFPYIESLYLST